MSDVLDILNLNRPKPSNAITRESFMGTVNKKKNKSNLKKTTGVQRELKKLINTHQNGGSLPPLLQTVTSQGYKTLKANLGMKRARLWKWAEFKNSARADDLTLSHWRREDKENESYRFADFNKEIQCPNYTDEEYLKHLTSDTWSRSDTNYLFEMCKRFDSRFIVINDRWDKENFLSRTVEDMKERYYSVRNILTRLRATPGQELTPLDYDANHERRRKEQSIKLYNRTLEEVEEEKYLKDELKKMEEEKRKRDKKTKNVLKLFSVPDAKANSNVVKKRGRKPTVAKTEKRSIAEMTFENEGIQFPEPRIGSSLGSHGMRLPVNIGPKKIDNINNVLKKLHIDDDPMPSSEIITNFNNLRSDIFYLNELKVALSTLENEAQMMKNTFEALTQQEQ